MTSSAREHARSLVANCSSCLYIDPKRWVVFLVAKLAFEQPTFALLPSVSVLLFVLEALHLGCRRF